MTMRVLHALARIGGDYVAIFIAYKEICKKAIELGNTTTIVTCLLGMGATVAVQGQFASAIHLWGKAKALYDPVNSTISDLQAYAWVALALRIHLDYDQIVVRVRAQLDEQSFEAAWNEGQTMTLEQLLGAQEDISLSQQPAMGPSHPRPTQLSASSVELTHREKDVLHLLIQELTDTQIAERLTLTRRTVNWYLTAIYRKLGVSSRSAAAQYAREHDML